MTSVERPLRKDAERNRQRILDAARELFAERGLGVTLNELAHHAGVGVGTVYRRFPDRLQLIEALLEQRVQEIVEVLEVARTDPDPLRALVGFHERALELQAQDRGLNDLLRGAPGAPERLARLRARLQPHMDELVQRARSTGQLRTDVAPEDFGIVHLMLSAVIEAGHEVAPNLWRRYFAILLDGLKAGPAAAEPLPEPPVSAGEIDDVLAAVWQRRRA
jgi:AcrR family transcriptional regulator